MKQLFNALPKRHFPKIVALSSLVLIVLVAVQTSTVRALQVDEPTPEPGVYLPLVTSSGNAQTQEDSAVDASNVFTSEVVILPGVNTPIELSPPGTPFEELVPCPDGETVSIDWKNLPPPDPNAPGCRAISVPVLTPELIESANGDFSEMAIPLPAIEVPAPASNEVVDDGSVEASSEEAPGQTVSNDPNYSWAINLMQCRPSCSSSNGVTSVAFVNSSKIPSKPFNRSWNDYHFYNRTHLGDDSQSFNCPGGYQTIPNLSIGTAYGRIGSYTISGSSMSVVWEEFTPGLCQTWLSNQNAPSNAGLAFDVYKLSGNNWVGRVWRGYWAYIFNKNFSWSHATYIEMGQELWARNQDKQNLKVPLNFSHKFTLRAHLQSTRPWWDGVLPSTVANKSTIVPNAPFNVMDSVPGDYTSISSEANQ